ncbi:MAG: ImmA/IrrE family metallo-endopeptidase [Synechococcus sp. SB0666_bin_14]|nr:ImmA/IrrE family metallo-endopeptidase [Synechococcus sp. SB0666_bin_14]MYA90800.1 ImmA/IrrE family metallo-endopeptidase [Synechococcus sp. SB0663_bin_10]MYG46115.1 ImmA/IrrE family metallo-endopeptidase [Synechococcus sp. SB0675_bin_6]MYJ60056.1 ImmA/IrrE family metallo-endopeptidase [Synechococcus sp. SB0672_bin_6]MYK90997.1 ImmA/IrrE family metallo-endopeptidase [Synechococcus sp. SB0669_bin_8]
MHRIAASPEVLRWARERAGLSLADLQGKFPRLADWEAETRKPTMKQLEAFAKKTRTPFGFLFLPEPPEMPLPFADFRRVENQRRQGVSPELMDTIHLMRRRQAWLREEQMEAGVAPLACVGSAKLADDPAATGRHMRQVLGLKDGWTGLASTWTAAVGKLRSTIEGVGIMAVINGIVGNNTGRKLDMKEFRGFALSDPYAPLIFVNGDDAKSVQMFTLAHELAHLWLGDVGEGLSGFQGLEPDGGDVERFCDQAAAEFLVPAVEIRDAWQDGADPGTAFENLARCFKVSPVVIGRRAMDLDLMEPERFFSFYHEYTQREYQEKQPKTGGGDFYNNQNTRVGRLLASQVIRAAKEGRIGFKEAYDLTGLNGGTFQQYARKLGIMLP